MFGDQHFEIPREPLRVVFEGLYLARLDVSEYRPGSEQASSATVLFSGSGGPHELSITPSIAREIYAAGKRGGGPRFRLILEETR